MAEERRQPCVGVESYIEANEGGYYVDKTLFIRDLCEGGSDVYLITRPGGFGKTLNLDMLKVFFEKTKDDNSVYFTDKKIWGEEEYRSEQGKYPVVFMSFKRADRGTWRETYKSIKRVIAEEYSRHAELETSDKVNGNDLDAYNLICAGKGDPARFRSSLRTLTRMLHAHYGVPAVVLIDDYDVPVRKGFDEAAGFMRDFLGNGLKTNFDMYLAVLTGVAPYAEVTAYHGLNNMAIHTVLGKKFSEYFGFTREEVQGILDHYGYGEKTDEVIEWYDGYDFGGREMSDPRSVMDYVRSGCTPKVYRADTSQTLTVRDILSDASYVTTERLMRLLQGETVSCWVDEDVELGRLKNAVFTLLLFSGYLKSKGRDPGDAYGKRYLLEIPNRETREAIEGEIASVFRADGRDDILGDVCGAVMEKDAERLEKRLREILPNCPGHDGLHPDRFYNILFLGMCRHLRSTHHMKYDGEPCEGRYDLSLEPLTHDPSLRAAIIEVKTVYGDDGKGKKTAATDGELLSKAGEALCRIDDKGYDSELKERGFTDIIKLGMAFSGDRVKVLFKE